MRSPAGTGRYALTVEIDGDDARIDDGGGSRWDIRDFSEVSGGLTVFYWFERKPDTRYASQSVGRLAYAVPVDSLSMQIDAFMHTEA